MSLWLGTDAYVYAMSQSVCFNLKVFIYQHKKLFSVYTANILKEKSEICHLHEEINKSEEAILSLCRQNNTNKENCNM